MDAAVPEFGPAMPGAEYELFTFAHHGSAWRVFVHPEYYGMFVFAQAFPPKARLLQVNIASGPVPPLSSQIRPMRGAATRGTRSPGSA